LWLRDIEDDIKGPHLDFFGGPNSLSHGSGIKHHPNCNPTTFRLTMQWKKVLPVAKSYFALSNFVNNASRQNSSAFCNLCPL